MQAERETYSYFWVEGFDCPAEDITNRIGISPTRISLRGTELPGGRTTQSSIWYLHSPLPRGDEFVDSSLEALISLLEPHAAEIRSISADYKVGINCVGYFFSYNPGFHLSQELIARIAALPVSVDFDLYNYCSKCDREEPSVP